MNKLIRMKWPDAEAELRRRIKAMKHGTKIELADHLGVSRTHLSQLTSGNRPMTREVGEKIAGYFKIEIDYQFKPADPTPAPPSRGEGGV